MKIALVKPEIPQNTGSIARTCAATFTPLHIIGEIPFEISDKTVRRAGLDYWPYVDLTRHENWESFRLKYKDSTFWYFSTHAKKYYFEAEFNKDDILVFGSETKGLGKDFISSVPQENLIKIPMPCENVRSLNLSNAVSVALYEARRQLKLDPPLKP